MINYALGEGTLTAMLSERAVFLKERLLFVIVLWQDDKLCIGRGDADRNAV